MVSHPSPPITIHADQEHDALRAVVVLVLVVLLVAFYGLIRWSVGLLASPTVQAYTTTISCAVALPLSMGVAWLIEFWLKRVWPSGHRITLEANDVTAVRKGKPETSQTLSWTEDCHALFWTFPLREYPRGGRERRLPKEWVCLAGQLRQGEERLSFYAFASPKRAKQLTENEAGATFQQLDMKQVYEDKWRNRFTPPSRPVIPAKILSSKNGRYWLAERHRWETGYELAVKDFELLVETIQTKLR